MSRNPQQDKGQRVFKIATWPPYQIFILSARLTSALLCIKSLLLEESWHVMKKALEALLCLDTDLGDVELKDRPAWFFVHRGSKLDVIPSLPHCNHYVVDVKENCYKLYESKC